MTRKEASFILANIDRRVCDDELSEALDIAIEALEILEEFEKAQIITGGRLNGRTYAYKCGLEDGKRKVLKQSPRWIPCSEKLPEKTGLYLINIGDLVTTANLEGHYFRTQSMVRYVPDAWMPLPQPYKAESEGV